MNKVIMLDEYDIYKAEHNQEVKEALERANLEPIEEKTEKFNELVKYSDEKPIVGTVLVKSAYKDNMYYSLTNLEEKLRLEYFKLLYLYAPLFGVSKITIKYYESKKDTNSSRKTKKSDVKISSGSIGTVGVGSGSDKSEKETNTEEHMTHDERDFNDLRVPIKYALEKLEIDGINYKNHNILHEIVQHNGGQKKISSEIDFTKQSKNVKKIQNEISAIVDSKVKIPIKIDMGYKENITSEENFLQIQKLKIEILFHEDKSNAKSKKFLLF